VLVSLNRIRFFSFAHPISCFASKSNKAIFLVVWLKTRINRRIFIQAVLVSVKRRPQSRWRGLFISDKGLVLQMRTFEFFENYGVRTDKRK